MAQATRLMTVRRGLDPAGFDLLAFGGAGPLHACRQAIELGFRSVIVPPDAGVLSAFGLLASVPRVDHRAAFRRRLDSVEPEEVAAGLERLEREALCRMPPDLAEGVLRRERAADMRYVGQSWDLRVQIGDGSFDTEARRRLRRDFDALHERTYGYASPDAPVETVHLAISLSAPLAPGVDGRRRRPHRGEPPTVDELPAGRTTATRSSARATARSVPVHHWADLASRPGVSPAPHSSTAPTRPRTSRPASPAASARCGVLHLTAVPA